MSDDELEYVDRALAALQSMDHLRRCRVGEVIGAMDATDVQMFLPTPEHEGVHDIYEACVERVNAHEGDGYRLEIAGTTQTTEWGEPYFHVSIHRDD